MAVIYTTTHNDTTGWDKIYVQTGGHFNQDGAAVQGFAIRKTSTVLKELQKRNTTSPEKLYFIGHQANLFMLQNVCSRCGIDTSRHLYNVDEFGNCAATGAPSVLSMNWEGFKAGDAIALAVAGAGLSWGGMLINVNG